MAIDAGTGLLIGAGLNYGAGKSAQNAGHAAVQTALGTLQGTEGYSDAMKAAGEQVLAQMLAGNQAIYGTPQEAALALEKAQREINGVNPYEAGTFDYKKEISDFYDPAFKLSVDTANQGINESQALGGGLFSSATADKIAAQNQVLASKMYKDALDAYNTDKSLEQGIWQGNEAAKQAAAGSAANIANMKYGMASDTAGNIASGQNDYYTALLGLNNDYWRNKTDYAAQLAALQAQDPGRSRGIFGDIASIFGF